MSTGATWQQVQAELQRRLRDRVWLPGEIIPAEAEIARELGCARTTVNRAMRELAEAGLLERRRRAGTRVVKTPVRRASFDIPIIREEVERRGAHWGYRLLSREKRVPPVAVANRLALPARRRALHIVSLHFADHRPFLIEDRWINLETVPGFEAVDLEQVSANEWLVQNAPYTHGDYGLSAANATAQQAQLLGVEPGAALLIVDRMTANDQQVITSVRLAYAPGHRVQTRL
ncbi:MAG: GntR family transcriptional regulator [Burkholderiaceae bacterium]